MKMKWLRVTRKEFFAHLTEIAIEIGDAKKIKHKEKDGTTSYIVNGKSVLKICDMEEFDAYFVRVEEG